MTTPKILHYYRETEPPHSLLPSTKSLLHSLSLSSDADSITSIRTESCFNVSIKSPLINPTETSRLEWLLSETFDPTGLRLEQSHFETPKTNDSSILIEFGPRMTFTSAFSSNAVNICHACGLSSILRLEKSRRYLIHIPHPSSISPQALTAIKTMLHDRMTEEEYLSPLQTFESGTITQPTKIIPISKEGRTALEKINNEMGLGFDDFDLDYYTDLFLAKLGRDPTDVECFDMGQSNSEHSRHWFFGGKMILDHEEQPHTLFQMVKSTLKEPSNSIIAFHDNSSAIRGYECRSMQPIRLGVASPVSLQTQTLHPILTAETHNFPCGVAPHPGAETGTGGRLRDVMATGRGAYPIAGISSYCVGNLRIPGHPLPWEDDTFVYPSNFATALQIEIEASNGASDYGNKYGEPVISGFTRSFGQRLPGGERFEWVKPIMFSAGIGALDKRHTDKHPPSEGNLVIKIGGPAYRIGIGGGAASSRVQSGKTVKLDFDAVQRGDAEMENRMNRVMRACCDLGEENPILSVHDQGAGGNGNVLKEIVEPVGAVYDIRKILAGDETLSVLELWGAEYQENNALLLHPSSHETFRQIAQRENCPYSVVGTVTNDGRVVVKDSRDGSTPVDLPLELVLGKMPQKTFVDESMKMKLEKLELPEGEGVMDVLGRVLRLLSVGSKRFLVHKVDRSVTGLIAQQQCIGPLQLPLSNVAVAAHTHFSTTGTATAIGEQPIKGLLDPAAMARLTVTEAMTNLIWAKLSSIEDIKASGNWMYAAKLPSEGSKLYRACKALRDALLELGVGIDGGKDSLSMAAKCGEEVVKAPGELTLTCYVTCPDITKTVTPDLKCPEKGGRLLYLDLGQGKARLGGSALAQVYNQIGDESPDMEDFKMLKAALEVTQTLIDKEWILAGHDRSDGGLAVTLLEMAFAGNRGMEVSLKESSPGVGAIATLFHEEAGMVLQVSPDRVSQVLQAYHSANVPCIDIGHVVSQDSIQISIEPYGIILQEPMTQLRDIWESTSFALEKLQRNPECVQQEQTNLKYRKSPQWKLTFEPTTSPTSVVEDRTHKVAILRQEGSNGDREMIAAFYAAGFEPWDVTVSDLLQNTVTLDQFRGVVFVGGFSYADVLDSSKGWAGVIKFNPEILHQFEAFRKRKDTFSLGVCNGCQLMALLGWVPFEGVEEVKQVRLLENDSCRFESRFSSVTILESPAVLFKGMENSSLGIWVAHGEGRFHFPDPTIHTQTISQKLAPLRYVDDINTITTEYPFNPNGSPDGIAALCSDDGRHLAMMPHPERVFLKWQWPWVPDEWNNLEASPWMRMFENARVFCDEHCVD